MAYRTYVDGPFGQMHVRMARRARCSKPALVCFHMSPMSGRIYERFIDAVGRERTAAAIDTPGFGMSDPPTALPSIGDYSRAMAAAIQALDLGQSVDLMGYHTGSMIAADLAADRPGLVRRLVLVSAPIFTDAERAEMRRLYQPVPPSLDGTHLVQRWRGFVHHNLGRGLSLEDVADMFPDGLLGRNRAWWGHHAAFSFAPDMRLPEVRQPVLLISPGDDLASYSRRAPPLMSNGRLVELPGWGHGFLDGFTGDAAKLVQSFLDAPDDAPFASLAAPQSGKHVSGD